MNWKGLFWFSGGFQLGNLLWYILIPNATKLIFFAAIGGFLTALSTIKIKKEMSNDNT